MDILKFYGTSINVDHYYYFIDDKGNNYYWKSKEEEVSNTCTQNGRLFGINATKYEIKNNGKSKSYDGKIFTEIKVIEWEVCK